MAHARRRYVAAVANGDGVTSDYVVHATDIAEAEQRAREEAERRDATLVEVTAAVPLDDERFQRRRGWRRPGTAFLAIAIAGAVASAVMVLVYGFGSAS